MKKTIFIVEDDIAYGTFIKELLERNNFSNVHLFNSEADLTKQLHLKPGVIIANYRLKGTNGLQLLHKSRKKLPCVYTILLTGEPYSMDHLLNDERFLLSVDRYIIKGMEEEHELVDSLKYNLAG